MSDSKRTFRHESLQEADTLADHLTEIAEALRAGTLHLSDDGGEMALALRGLVRFELTGYEQADQAGVTIALTWRSEEDIPPSTLEIGTVNDGSSGS